METLKLSRRKKDLLFSLLLLLPTVLVIFWVVAYPLAKGVVFSFFDYKLITYKNPTWNSFGNYKALFVTGEFIKYLANTMIFVCINLFFQIFLSIVIAASLNSKLAQGRTNLLRSLFLIPWLIPQIVVGVTWMWLFQAQYGVINFVLKSIGLLHKDVAWIATTGYAMAAVLIAAIWRQLPISITMILAGIQSVPIDIIESAYIEGAKTLRMYRSVILPYMRTLLGTVILITIINNFQLFTIIWIMTAGGPAKATTTLSIGAYKEAFMYFDLGKGCAIGFLWLVILSVAGYLYNRNLLKGEM